MDIFDGIKSLVPAVGVVLPIVPIVSRMPKILDSSSDWREKIHMSTTHKHIQTLEKEGILNVKQSSSIKRNFQNLFDQGCERQKILNRLQAYFEKDLEQLETFNNCVDTHMEHLLLDDGQENQTYLTKKNFNQCKNEFFSTFKNVSKENKQIKSQIQKFPTLETPKTQINEKIGFAERKFMHHTYSMIEKKEFESPIFKLDVDQDIRARDNLNRVSNQINHMHEKINEQLNKLDSGSISFEKCLKKIKGSHDSVSVKRIQKCYGDFMTNLND